MKLKDIKNWGPDVEKSIVESWKKSEAYNFNKKSKKKQAFLFNWSQPLTQDPCLNVL